MRTLGALTITCLTCLTCLLGALPGCGRTEPPAQPSPQPPSSAPAGAPLTADPGSSSVEGCPFVIKRAWAMQAVESVRLPPNGGTTDAASVVQILAYTTIEGPLTLRYQAGLLDCAAATFPGVVSLDAIGPEPGEHSYVGLIPAFRRGTHVCWKLTADVCGGILTSPPVGTPAFDYTTD